MQENNTPRRARPPMGRSVIPPSLEDPGQRRAWCLPESEDTAGEYVVELNLLHAAGLRAAEAAFGRLFAGVAPGQPPPHPVSRGYLACRLTLEQVRELARAESGLLQSDASIHRLWPDFPLAPLLDRSTITVKSDAALRCYSASGQGIVWAVVDSGIDGSHEHFRPHQTLSHSSVAALHRDFTGEGGDPLSDAFGHGTHVAGIIAGALPPSTPFTCYEHFSESPSENRRISARIRQIDAGVHMRGMAPECRLVSLKVLDANGQGRASGIMRALQYIREELNADPKFPRIHGVNLSLGYEFDAEMFACGQSPLCVEVDRLVKSGVVVVAAAGNTGYGRLAAQERYTKAGLSNTINDPGNSGLAITVGATHRDSPHLYGVSYFSSKGPTGDGRLKPDLVAPGERITSCATGSMLDGIQPGGPAYIDFTGTSMAAPHVSGAIAAFLSIRKEFIQRPEEIKRIFLESATSLQREKYFQGHGLLDLMRAIQSV